MAAQPSLLTASGVSLVPISFEYTQPVQLQQNPSGFDTHQEVEKKLFRTPTILLVLGILFAVPIAPLFGAWGSEPRYLYESSTGWRLYHGLRTDEWRVCNLKFYNLDGEVSLKDVRVVSSPPVPRTFDISSSNCDSFWSSKGDGTNKGREAYIGVVFPHQMNINRIQFVTDVETTCKQPWWDPQCTGCISASSCASCCRQEEDYPFLPNHATLQRLGNSEQWTDTFADQHLSKHESVSIYAYDGHPPYNDVRPMVLLVCAISCSSLALGFFLVVVEVFWHAWKLKQHLSETRDELNRGAALVLSYGNEQWVSFVENEWNPNGRQAKENSFLKYVMYFILAALLAPPFLWLKCHLHESHLEDWSLLFCAKLGLPVAFFFTIPVYPVMVCRRRRKYQHLVHNPQEGILASSTLTFEEMVLFQSDWHKKITSTGMEQGQGAEGTLLVISYTQKRGKTTESKKLRIPLPHGRTQEVKMFITNNSALYKPSASLSASEAVEVPAYVAHAII